MPYRITCCKTNKGEDGIKFNQPVIFGVQSIDETLPDIQQAFNANIKTVKPITWHSNTNFSTGQLEYDIVFTIHYSPRAEYIQTNWYVIHKNIKYRVKWLENVDKANKYIKFYCKTELKQ
jgi:hypothetical protein